MNTYHDILPIYHGQDAGEHTRAGRFMHLSGMLVTEPTPLPVLFIDQDDGNSSTIAVGGGVYDGTDGNENGGIKFEDGADPVTLALPLLPVTEYVIGATGKLEPLGWQGSSTNSRRVVAWRGPMNGPFETIAIIAPYEAP